MPKEKEQLSSYLSGTGVNSVQGRTVACKSQGCEGLLNFKAHTLAGYGSAHL